MFTSLWRRPGKRPSSPPRRAYLSIEVLEERQLLSTYTVTTTDDSGPGSLRRAIKDADNDPGSTIPFRLPAGR